MIEGSLFPTAIGTCAVAWNPRMEVAALHLPGDKKVGLERTLRRSGAAAHPPPAPISRLISRLQRHLEGTPDPLRDVSLDTERLPPFTRRVYRELRGVPPGETTTYGSLARRAGSPGASRAVGQAMAHNPFTLIVPCHRVLGAAGDLGGFSAHGGTQTKLRLLTIEGVDLKPIAAAGVRALGRRDSRLARVIRGAGCFRMIDRQPGDPFVALAEAIVHQQVSVKAGATIFGRLRDRVAGGGAATFCPERLLALDTGELRSAGLSRQKTGYLRDLAEKTLAGTLALDCMRHLDDELVIQRLTRVKGIGRWSAEMFLMFQLGRLDVLPVDDLGLRSGIQRLFGLRARPDAARIRRLAAPWIPFRSIATWYLWRYLESGGP